MPRRLPNPGWSAIALALPFVLTGCGRSAESSSAAGGATSAAAHADQQTGNSAAPAAPAVQPIRLGNVAPAADVGESKPAVASDPAARTELIRNKLQPLQVLIGSWDGKAFRQIRDLNPFDEPRWKWDLSQKGQPALLMESPKNAYITRARLTFVPDKDRYLLETVHPQGQKRTFEGEFIAPVRDEVVDGEDHPQRTFELQFTEVGGEARDAWQVTFQQQRNDRYLTKLFRQRPGTPAFDVAINTLAMQRQGTSFAQSDSDYGDRTCIISEGLGTIQLTYAGKTFWVCCTGCKAAFEEAPEEWIARAEQRAKAKR